MSILAGIFSGFTGALFVLFSFLFVLTVVVFIHELGHFLVARWCGVKVQIFSIGFGKEVWGFYDRHGTRWRFAWVPLGGYVKFVDDENAASVPSHEAQKVMTDAERAGAFHLKPLWQRAAVVAAGPAANFIMAILIFAGMFMSYGQVHMEPRIGKVLPGTPAAASGFQPGDLVTSINGQKIKDFIDIQQYVSSSPGRVLKFVVVRGDVLKTLTTKPVFIEQNDRIAGKHKRPVIGIQASRLTSKVTHEKVGPIRSIGLGVDRTWGIITQTLSYLGDVVTSRQKPDQVGGLLRIADASGKVARLGPEYIIQFIAFISVSVGLINLFPIPLLDGGHLMFYAYEAVRGRPLSERSQEIGFRIGFALVLSLMIFATWNDRGVVARWLDLDKGEKVTVNPVKKQAQ